MNPLRVFAFVLAGGEGRRLRPFTTERPKPALSFGGGYRLIDFVLSNLFHSGVDRACVLLDYQPGLLARHLADGWRDVRSARAPFLQVVVPRTFGAATFHGTADAVAQSLDAADALQPDVIAVFAADHVYRMDVRQMLAFHTGCAADATVAAVPVPLGRARHFGVIRADADGRIRGFEEKPAHPRPSPGHPGRAFASMGNYLFRPAVLRKALAEALARGEHDFGRHVLPRLVQTDRVFAYDLARNQVPGVQAGEERAYWRDVGTVDAYVEAHWDLLGPQPRLRLDNPQWPIRSSDPLRMPGSSDGADVRHSIIGPGANCGGARVHYSVLQRGAHVAPGADLEHCIVMESARVGRGARLRDAIVGERGLFVPLGRAEPRPGRRTAGMAPLVRSAGLIVTESGRLHSSMQR
jgi:glucose-1-phosphate adenylyltransferase